MEQLVNYLLLFGQLNQQQIDLLTSKVKVVVLKRNEYFSEAGKTAKHIGFIINGVMRVCYYNNEGKEITRYFIDENNFVVDLNSYSWHPPFSCVSFVGALIF
ncbi:Crp/Fnr family transcriptional regulator [Arcicella rigui]|uniref:Crp/Fnr family transcriptional regulator n=1 Tax=Arcicella rigui TaxID=797020 RepID=A0ABU5QCW9_9BACT|nr:Crp/Fnr family transcriptional regulator [Arcicella rigui]MEA5140199.1 Crp/Fnr family transcriptional regulator [Arcicella rigui]